MIGGIMNFFKSLSIIGATISATLALSANESSPCPTSQGNSCTGVSLGTSHLVPQSDSNKEVWGIADMHTHPFADEGFGGLFFQGKTHDAEGLAAALPSCSKVHGPYGITDFVGNAASGRVSHKTEAYPSFRGWPAWNGINHQQVYYKWLERAHRGGLRLIVSHAVNSEALCTLMNKKESYTCNDMEAVDRQIEAATSLEKFIDGEHSGDGWLRIVRSPAEARRVIAEGKLAMVLGIEVDSLFDCDVKGCDAEGLIAKLDHYHSRGIRHILPVHVTDNGLGGAAMYSPYLFNYANRVLNGTFFRPEDCSGSGYTYRETKAAAKPNLLGLIIPQYPDLKAFCNARSLTPLGETLILELMQRGMIIDVDHMSAKTTNAVIAIAQAHHYPLASGHTGFIETSASGQKRSEAQKTDLQLRRILRLGGVVAPILQQGNAASEILGGGEVNNDCDRSSKAYAQALLYAFKIAREETDYPIVGLGSDFNGIIESPAPRFGADGCAGNKMQASAQAKPVVYPFYSKWAGGTFAQQRTGERLFNINSDGFAHVGLLPDFVEDLSHIGVSDEVLTALFRSAEGYLRMWERTEAIAHNPSSPKF